MWQKDAEMDKGTRRLAAEKDPELVNFHENLKSTRKLAASGNSDIDGIGTVRPQNLHISTAYAPHLEKVFSNVRQRYGRKLGDKIEDLDVNAIKWKIFLFVFLQAAVHLERLCREFTFHQEMKEMKQTEKEKEKKKLKKRKMKN